jgi:hypothetical protein
MYQSLSRFTVLRFLFFSTHFSFHLPLSYGIMYDTSTLIYLFPATNILCLSLNIIFFTIDCADDNVIQQFFNSTAKKRRRFDLSYMFK